MEELWKTIEPALGEAFEKAQKTLVYNLNRLRSGRATPSFLDGVNVDYYGTPTPINQVGQVSTPEARLLQIQPFDKSMISAIEKAVLAANLGVTPSNDGNLIRIPFPALSEERRKELVKSVKKNGEDAKIAIRNGRRDQNEVIKKEEKDKNLSEDESKKLQEKVQKVIDGYIAKIDEIVSKKEADLLTV